MRKIIRFIRECKYRLLLWLRDPALDILGAGLLGTYLGRSVILGSIAAGLWAATMYWQAVSFVSLMALDGLLQAETMVALRKLMRYEVMAELMA